MIDTINFNLRKIILAVIVAFFSLCVLPDTVSAQSIAGELCNGPDCNSCHLVDLGNNLIQWLIGVITVLFGVLMVIAGFGLVTSGGNPSALQSAKDKFINALIGFLIVLSAWLLIDTIMRSLLPGDTGQINGTLFWAEVECYEANASFAEAIDFDVLTSSAPIGCTTVSTTYDCSSQIAACESQPGAVATDNGDHIICDSPAGVAAVTDSTAVCDVGPGGDRVICTAQVAACEASGGESTIDDSDPTRYEVQCEIAGPNGACQTDRMTSINLFGFSTTVDNSIASRLQAVHADWESRGGHGFYRVTSVGAYNCRRVTGGSSYSVHAFGLAVDVNPAQNGYVRTTVRPCPNNMTSSGFQNLFKSRGFGWGGDWRSVCDAMHFSDASNEGGTQSLNR